MTSRDEEGTTPGAAGGGPAPVLLVATTIGLGLTAHVGFDLDAVAAAAGTIGLVAAQWATMRAVRAAAGRPTIPRRRMIQRRTWPDVGMTTVVEALDDPCLLVDGDGAVRRANATATTRFPGVKLGEPLSFGLRIPALRDAVAACAASGAAQTVEWHEKVPTERWFEAHLAPIRVPDGRATGGRAAGERTGGGRPDFVLIRVVDLTEARRLERMRADFVANASHELRTPLAAVTGFIETLQGPARDDAAARVKFLAVMAEQAWRMKRLIDDLLSLSRVEMRAHLKPEARVDLAEVLAQVIDLVGKTGEAAGVRLELSGAEAALPVIGDRDELVQVFSNLTENAVKYGGSGGRVAITAAVEGGQVVVTVRDFGAGIDPVHLPRLTERFYRAHTETSGTKRGTGLGLAIVKHIVTRHGGRLDIASTPGEGSTFTVRLDSPLRQIVQ